ncbi:hypothetical protein Cri9333_4959 (plasmid) [Crinalium epipsammum PCC 9333]|uniref:Uncharacterized protein n=1 Tax=Crinalium epipsammum PCC 9333 TaxID=1173022 RepID=K9W7D6_9CYAN|nr:hypothetical protein [Crinalium epipsammum]AFZ15714.1 hypothetical protein Cri9333_4959 [Crinalium epipsammum PCC 9333]
MSDDALERLKTRKRPSVQSRDASLISSSVDISTSRYQETVIPGNREIQTKQTTLRLEAGISDRLMAVTRKNGISREVLIEAVFEHYEADPQAWGEILAEAKKRAEQRTKLANIKRAKSMMQRFSPPVDC